MVRTMNNNKPLLLFCVPALLTASLLSSAAVDGNGKIFDITHKISSELPTFDSKEGLGHFIWLVSSIKNGSSENASEFELGTHTGTHVDAPSHFFQQYYEEGFDVTTLSLQTLNGPALVVDVLRCHNITAEVMKSLNIPRGVHRVLFKTLNTDRRLMHKTEFASDFTGFKKDGAQWLVDNTDIKLVGVDYLSVSAYVDAAHTHHILLKSRVRTKRNCSGGRSKPRRNRAGEVYCSLPPLEDGWCRWSPNKMHSHCIKQFPKNGQSLKVTGFGFTSVNKEKRSGPKLL